MTYTINGKEWTELDINRRCAELLAWESEPNVKSVEFDVNCFWVGHVTFSPFPVFKPFKVKDYCSNPADTDAIIDKCWDELSLYVDCDGDKVTYETFSDAAFKPLSTKQQFIMDKNKCTKLVAACICYIEINEGKS